MENANLFSGKKLDEHLLDKLFLAMIKFDEGDAKRIQHFTKVHSYARLIARSENMNEDDALDVRKRSCCTKIGTKILN